MAKQQTIVSNQFSAENTQLDKYDKKYLRHFQDFQNKAAIEAFEAFRTKDLTTIENTLKLLTQSVTNNMYIIGIGCLIIEREKLYLKAGYIRYYDYAKYIFDDADLPTSTISNAKIIMERYMDYEKQLKKAGFVLERNANKLVYLEEALQNHEEAEVYRHIVEDTFRQFRDWAQRKSLIGHKPEKDAQVDAQIKGDKLLINGKNILNFPKDLPEDMRELVKDDLQKTFSIREGGNQPFIIGTYGKGEQIALDNYLKSLRSKK